MFDMDFFCSQVSGFDKFFSIVGSQLLLIARGSIVPFVWRVNEFRFNN